MIPVDLAVLDFSKAFDVVSHQKLLVKLMNIGIADKTVKWIFSWLQSRLLSVCVNNVKSATRHVTSGVPQGSVLGPLLSNVYINDMHSAVANSKLKLYADDSLLYKPITTPADSSLFQNDLDHLITWADSSQMKFNVNKCEHMTIQRSTVNPLVSQYSINKDPLQCVDKVLYLGVTIDNKLSFDQHIINICSKANKSLHMLMRCLKKAKSKTRAIAYKTVCRPILEFATHTWSPFKLKNINMIEGINRKAFRWTFCKRKRDHITELMIKSNWDTLAQRRDNADQKMYFRMLSFSAAIDQDRFSLHFAESHNTRHGAIKGNINTKTAKHSYKHRIHKLF